MSGKTIEERIKNYSEIKKESKELYDSFCKIFSPAIGSHVHFTSNGFNHLVYKNAKKKRDKKTQILRFDLLKKAKYIIEVSTTFQELEEDFEYTRVNRHGKYVSMNLIVRHWAFVAIVDNLRVKVVLRQVGNGKVEFFSVIPGWKLRQYRDIKIINNSAGSSLKYD